MKTKSAFLSSDHIPSSLRSRDGWSDFLELQRPVEPHLHQIEPTNHCPYSCVMCPRGEKMDRKLGFMEMDLYRKVIDEIAGYSEPVRSKKIELFHFGESLLHPKIDEMVHYASSAALNISLSVNAPEINPSLARKLLESNPFKVIISLDGYNERSYREIRGKKADFSRAVSNIEKLIKIHREIKSSTEILVRMISLKANINHSDSFKKQWEKKGITVEIRPFFPWSEKEMAELGEFEKYPPFMPCPFPWQYLVVQWNGDVVPCCRDYNGVNRIGNVKDNSLKDIWNGPNYAAFRQQHRIGDYKGNSFCNDCMDIYYQDGDSRESPLTLPEIEDATITVDGEMSTSLFTGMDHDLSLEEKEVLYWALRMHDFKSIAHTLEIADDRLAPIINRLEGRGLIKIREKNSAEELSMGGGDLASLWKSAAKKYGARPFIRDDSDGSCFTYEDADEVISAIMHRLQKENVKKGDSALIWGPVHSEAILFFWAAVRSGIVVVPLDPALPLDEANSIINRVSPKIIFADGGLCQKVDSATVKVVVFDGQEDAEGDNPALSEWLSGDDFDTDKASVIDNLSSEPAVILFTSGTTGRCKGVVHSHSSMAHSGRLMAVTYGWEATDVLLSPGDLHTMSGLRNPCISSVYAGCSVLVTSEDTRRNISALSECATRHGVTLMTTVPATLQQINIIGSRRDFNLPSKLRMIMVTGSRLSSKVKANFSGRYNVPLYNYYGLTETAGLCAGEIPGMDGGGGGEDNIGYPVDSLFRIVDDKGNDVKDGEKGELWIQSANLMKGYYNDKGATKKAIRGRWFRTGDLAVLNSDGTVSLVGRLKDIIKNSHGEIISFSEVEEAMLRLDGVSDAAVCSTTDDEGREQLSAFVVPVKAMSEPFIKDEWLAELRNNLNERLGVKKLPSAIRIVEHIPKSSNGKVLRGKLEKMVKS